MPDEHGRPHPARGRATLKEVARLAGVSRSTTSRVLNDHPSVRDDVRARVQQVMDDVGYVPDRVARSLRRGRSGIVGLLIPQPPATVFGDAYFAALVSAVVRVGQDVGCTVAMVLVDEPSTATSSADPALVERVAAGGLLDGVLLTASVEADPLPAALAAAGVPVVVIGEPADDVLPSVDVDNGRGGRLAVEHLVAQGRERLALVGGPAANASARSRLDGARAAVAGTAVAVVADTCADAFAVEAGRAVVSDLLADGQPTFDGLVAGSDAIAFGAMQALAAHGRSIPGDVAVVGFDDLPPAVLATPGLTTVRQPVEEVGRRALDRLLSLLDGDPAPTRQVLDVDLVVRASS